MLVSALSGLVGAWSWVAIICQRGALPPRDFRAALLSIN
jgi:hypothetical protein